MENVVKKEKILYIDAKEVDKSKAILFSLGSTLLMGGSFLLLNYITYPYIVAGTLSLGALLGLVALVSVAWTIVAKISSKYIKQYLLAVKGQYMTV